MKLSIIIVNYKVKYFLEQALYSIYAALDGYEDAEIFVVDNNSNDDSIEYLKDKFPLVNYIVNETNVGFATANNQAIKQCKGEYILLLNPDTVIGEDFLRTILYFLDEHTEAGAVGVRMINNNGVFLPESKRCFPTPWVSFCKIFGLSKFSPNSEKWAKYSLPYLNEYKKHSVEVLAGACMFIRKSVLDEIGLFDESFFMYGEDIDLSYRIVKGGYKNYYLPEHILHYKGESSKQDDEKYIKRFYGAMHIFYKKYYPENNFLFNIIITSAIAIKGALSRIFGILGLKNKPKQKDKRILVLSYQNRYKKIEDKCKEQFDTKEIHSLNLQKYQIKDILAKRQLMNSYTDLVLCYPDLRFEQILFFMDKMKNKKVIYHIYNSESNQLL